MELFEKPIIVPPAPKEECLKVDDSFEKIRDKLPEEKSKEQVIAKIKSKKETGLLGFALEGLVQSEQQALEKEQSKKETKIVELSEEPVEEQFPWIFGYTIEKELGRGSFGTVYLAKDEQGNQKAIKVLHNKEKIPQDLEKTIEQISAKIDDARIVKIKECKLENDFAYLVMDYVDGKALDTKQDNELFKLKVMSGLAQRIAYLHSRDIAHFDIKPGNILIGKEGEVYLADVELAQIIKQKEGLEQSLRTTMLNTDSKHLLGTIKYMAPELCDEKTRQTADLQADIYSLGVVMYELLTNGEFPGSEAREELKERKVPDKLIDIVIKALKKDKTKRYQKVDELLGELHGFYEKLVYEQSPEYEKREKAKIKYIFNALNEKGTKEEQGKLFNEAFDIKETNLDEKVDAGKSYWAIAKTAGEIVLSPFMLPTYLGRRITESQTVLWPAISACFTGVSMGCVGISLAIGDFIFPLIYLGANAVSGVYELAMNWQEANFLNKNNKNHKNALNNAAEVPKMPAEYCAVAQVMPQQFIATGTPMGNVEQGKQISLEQINQRNVELMYATNKLISKNYSLGPIQEAKKNIYSDASINSGKDLIVDLYTTHKNLNDF